MENITLWLGIIMSIILFANKTLLLIDRKSGWLVGAIGTILAILYLLILHFYVMTVAEIGIVILMLYGYFHKDSPSEKIEWLLRLVTVATFLCVGYFTFSGTLTVIEGIGSIAALAGVYLFTHRREDFSWFLYCVTHICTAYMAHAKHQQFFMDFQIASAVVSLTGIIKTRNTS